MTSPHYIDSVVMEGIPFKPNRCPSCGGPIRRTKVGDYEVDRCRPCSIQLSYSSSDGYWRYTTPMLRRARMDVHSLLDPLWKSGRMRRSRAYKDLRRRLGMTSTQCHVAHFGTVGCLLAITALRRRVTSRGISYGNTRR